MSTRGGDNTKKAQKHKNTFAFKHNKNSLLTRKIRETPLDHLCKRCLEKLEWRINYRKYKPLTSVGRCNLCQDKAIYKAYRTICDKCGDKNKICTKCCTPVGDYANRRNDPSTKIKEEDPLEEIMKNLKERYRRTIERKLQEGEDIIFDDEKGIINDETGEVVVDIRIIRGDFENFGINDESDDENVDIKDNNNKMQNDNDKESKKHVNVGLPTITQKKGAMPDEELIDTFKAKNDEDLSGDELNEDGSDEEDNEINK